MLPERSPAGFGRRSRGDRHRQRLSNRRSKISSGWPGRIEGSRRHIQLGIARVTRLGRDGHAGGAHDPKEGGAPYPQRHDRFGQGWEITQNEPPLFSRQQRLVEDIDPGSGQ